MTTDYERGLRAAIDAVEHTVLKNIHSPADALDAAMAGIAALIPPASSGAGGALEIGDTDRLKMPRMTNGWPGIPNAPDLNAEALKAAKEAMVKASGLSPMWGENVAQAGARAAVTAYLVATTAEPRGCPTPGAVTEAEREVIDAVWQLWERNAPLAAEISHAVARLDQARSLAADAQRGSGDHG